MTGGYSLLVADLIGVAVFAASGAGAAVAKRLDLFGVAFVGFVAALGGGTLKALDAGVPAVGACLIGMLTGIGGGLARDLLTGEIPAVLQRDIHAVVALGGAIAVAILRWLGGDGSVAFGAAAALMIAVRLLALYRRWSAPVAVP
jgi:uncharacterized membrane protein YeiH